MLDPKLARHFYRYGFAVVRQWTPVDDLARVRELLDGLFDRFDKLPKNLAFDLGDVKLHQGAQRTPQVNAATQFEPRLKETETFKRALVLARELLGDDANFAFDHAIYKPPRNGRATPWHQDMAYGGPVDRPAFNVNFWIPLQAASIDSGTMQFIPGSHWGPLLPHHQVGRNARVHTLETDLADTSRAVACPLELGDCTWHQHRTLHYTAPNDTDLPRRAWILSFSTNPTEYKG